MDPSLDGQAGLLHPRSYPCFYHRILAGCSIQQRPETKFCEACRKLPAVREELTALSIALTTTKDLARWDHDQGKAESRAKELQAQIGRLKQHEIWLETQRKTVGHCKLTTMFLYL
jgi:hypothetical protein